MEKKYFEITWISLWRILAFVLAITGLYLIREILILLALAILISSVCQPWVDFLQKKKVSRFLGTFFVFILILIILKHTMTYMVSIMVIKLLK